MKRLHLYKKAARPTLKWLLIIMVGPLAIATGLVDSVFPGLGTRFANGFNAYLSGLPENFWWFAAATIGVMSWGRSFGDDKKYEMEEMKLSDEEQDSA